MAYFFTLLIRLYQVIVSPCLPPSCRFYPTCSSYSIQAVERFGFPKGMSLTFRRLIRCHPFCSGGYDPVK